MKYFHAMLYGDGVTRKDLEFAKELFQLERIILGNPDLSSRGRAKCLVSLCYDYISINLEEKAESLYPKIKEVCPDYFKTYMVEDVTYDPEFRVMVEKIIEYFDSVSNRMD